MDGWLHEWMDERAATEHGPRDCYCMSSILVGSRVFYPADLQLRIRNRCPSTCEANQHEIRNTP